jgi:hypothetical protein
MADDEQFDIDTDDSERGDDDDENEESDDDTGFFPIDEPIVHSSQSSTTTTTSSQTSKKLKETSEQSVNKYSTSVNASNNYPQDNNFEYVGKCHLFDQKKKTYLNIISFSIITR